MKNTNHLFLIFVVAVLSLALVSTSDLGNVKVYDSVNKEYTITANLGAGQELAKMKLITPEDFNVIDKGKNVLQLVAEVEFVNFTKQSNALSKIQFYNNKKYETNRNFEYKWRMKIGTTQKKVTSYNCEPITPITLPNGTKNTEECASVVIATNTEDVFSDWVKFSDISELPDRTVRVGIFTDVKEDDNVEWIPTWYSERLDAWAGWSSSMSEGLKSFITFNNTAGTVSNNTADFTHHNATLNGTNFLSNGLIGGAVNLTSTYSQVNFSHPIKWWNTTTNQSTISFWVNGSAPEDSLRYALHWGNLADTPILFIRRTGGTTLVASTETGTEFSFSGANWIKNDTWTHVVLQIDNNWTGSSNGEVTLWINGTLVGNDTTASVNLSKSTTEFFLLGGRTGSQSLVGLYDEFGYWDRILSPSEISDLYNEHKGLTYNQNSWNLNITYPIGNKNYTTPMINLNYTTTLNHTCKWSNSSGAWNSSYVTAGINFTAVHNVTGKFGSNTWTVYCNDTSGLEESDEVSFDYGIVVRSQTYNSQTASGNIENFSINISIDSDFTVSSAIFVYNNTNYTADSVNSYGLGDSKNYTISKMLTVPTVTTDINKTFYWKFNFGSSRFYNSSFTNQTVANFGIDDCSVYTNLLLNYTIYDEITKVLAIDTLIPTTRLDITIYALDYSTAIATKSFNSSTNNTKVCLKNDLGNSNYYLEVANQYRLNEGYDYKYNHIQKRLITNTTVPIQVPLYSLNSSLSTEFKVTYKDKNFIKAPDVLVDVSRKYIEDGVFRTVEVAKTGSDGQTVVHLQKNDAIYTITFKKFGETLSVMDSVVAKCQSDVLESCEINENAFSSTINIDDFTFVNGLSFVERFDEDTKTITVIFTTDSGTRTVSLNATKFDRFGNTTVCSDYLISSSGTLSCIIPDSFGNSTVVSNLYSDGELVDSRTYTLKADNPDDSGSYVILALLFVITLSTAFISDVRGILLGCFLGLVLSSTLLYINMGNLFAVGSVLSWALITIIIIIWKINQKEDR